MAATGLYAPKWTVQIETEWKTAITREHPHLRDKLNTRTQLMREAVPDWEVANEVCQKLLPSLDLPDPDDRHVLAASICAPADCIVTFNLKDFPFASVSPFNIEVIHPDDFLVAQFDLNPVATLTAMKEMRNRKKNPPLSPKAFHSALIRNQLTALASRLDDALDLI